MTKGRLEAFSDGVIAILITIMVLQLHAPKDGDFDALDELMPVFSFYVLSFVMLGIYWNNHHHMLHAVREVNGRVLWANLHLLFWLSLVPFTTSWMGDHPIAAAPVALYGLVLLMAGVAYFILSRLLIAAHAGSTPLSRAVGSDKRGKLSIALYAAALPLAFLTTWAALGIYVVVAFMWLVPDRRIEDTLAK